MYIPVVQKKLNLTFWTAASFVAAVLTAVYILHKYGITVQVPPGSPRLWGILFLLLTALCCIATPILIRTGFHDRAVKNKNVTRAQFEKYQKGIILTTFAGAFIADLAYLFLAGQFYVYGCILAAIYGVYGAIPTRKKITAEMRFYNLEDGEED